MVFMDSLREAPSQIGDILTPHIASSWCNTLVMGSPVTLLSTAWATPLALLALGSPCSYYLDGLMGLTFLTPPLLVSLAWHPWRMVRIS
ncbi:hypothetical protein [Thermostichus vulcanus]|uniref:Uncharacterized protein n=1 Tax=Thermostichus vulcanus str. 'Rupite' TaxID=2813851 RepID=A0ABT0CEA4_THEVL|nr:hypothetical protein [Thermostichus vulcanus]MCJ2544118.1 hypothetical protein [Thermostichus vulcanus str. 'Rupite']